MFGFTQNMSHSLPCEGSFVWPNTQHSPPPLLNIVTWLPWTIQVTLLVFVRQMFLWFASVQPHVTDFSYTNTFFSKSLILNVVCPLLLQIVCVFSVLCCVSLEPFHDIRGEFVTTALTRKKLLLAMYLVLFEV